MSLGEQLGQQHCQEMLAAIIVLSVVTCTGRRWGRELLFSASDPAPHNQVSSRCVPFFGLAICAFEKAGQPYRRWLSQWRCFLSCCEFVRPVWTVQPWASCLCAELGTAAAFHYYASGVCSHAAISAPRFSEILRHLAEHISHFLSYVVFFWSQSYTKRL